MRKKENLELARASGRRLGRCFGLGHGSLARRGGVQRFLGPRLGGGLFRGRRLHPRLRRLDAFIQFALSRRESPAESATTKATPA